MKWLWMKVCIYACMCECMYVYVCMYVCMYAYIHTHPYIHTCIQNMNINTCIYSNYKFQISSISILSLTHSYTLIYIYIYIIHTYKLNHRNFKLIEKEDIWLSPNHINAVQILLIHTHTYICIHIHTRIFTYTYIYIRNSPTKALWQKLSIKN